MADQEADAMQTDPRDVRIAALELRLQEAEQRRHQSQDALTMRIAALECKLASLEAQDSRNPNLDELLRRTVPVPGNPDKVTFRRRKPFHVGYIADHFNDPDPTQPAGPGRRIGWLYVSDELMEKPDLMERLLAGGTVLRRKRRGGDYGLLIERDEFDPYEGDEDSAPLYTVTIDIYGGVEWRRA